MIDGYDFQLLDDGTMDTVIEITDFVQNGPQTKPRK